MAHYSIYIPGATAPNPALLDQVGLPGLVRDNDVGPQLVPILNNGPDGGGGLLFTWLDVAGIQNNPVQGYSADVQRWEPAPRDPVLGLPEKRYWFGFEPQRPPTPEDLLRRNPLPGFHAPLADGNDWLVPNSQRLPHRFAFGADGHETTVVKPEYAELYRKMQWCYDAVEAYVRYGGRRDPVQFRDYLAGMLSQNYRLNLPLCYWLQLFDETNWWTGSLMTVDWMTLQQIEEDLKKKEAALSPST